mmetsp:Transcript_1701/g.2286  ORF Transcript_1701/g.2286 Transcript_1701/m.2286 type:complete len:229 (-) Transcript_1701:42-728(-)|eukprot:jgi/Bigna1/83253/fgenesh1_pg.104_\
MEPSTALPDAKTVFKDGPSSFSPIVKLDGKKIIVRDFTKTGTAEEPLAEGTYDIGRYNELRPGMYVSELYQDQKNEIEGYNGERNIHMGLDIGGPAGTPVHSFADGTIHCYGYNPEKGDYGHVVIIKYQVNNTPVWALYGHLSGKSCGYKYKGMSIKKGDVIGWFGTEKENGGWPPHVHFQLSFIEPKTHDLPGVVSLADHSRSEKQFPDPRLVLGPLYPGEGLFRPK